MACSAAANEMHQLKKGLQAEYVHKHWLIRGFYGGDKLVYDTSGKLVKGGSPESWTVAELEITSLKLHGHVLDISGKRIALVYDANQQRFLPNYRISRRGNHAQVETANVKVEVPDPLDEANLRQVSERILIPVQADLVPIVPDFWRDFLTHGEQPDIKPEPGSVVRTLADGEQVHCVGREITAPPNLNPGSRVQRGSACLQVAGHRGAAPDRRQDRPAERHPDRSPSRRGSRRGSVRGSQSVAVRTRNPQC